MGENICQLYIWQTVTRIYKGLKKLNSKKTNNLIKKWAVGLNRGFSEAEIQMVKKHFLELSTSEVMTEMQSKTSFKILSHPSQNDHKTTSMIKHADLYVGKGKPYTLLTGAHADGDEQGSS